MPMTREEAQRFVGQLKNGKEFATRFQEEEWGLRLLDGDQFQKWSHRVELFTNDKGEMDGRDENSQEILTEEQVIELMMKWYSYDVRWRN